MGLSIPFNKPYTTGQELQFISSAIASGHLSGNGQYSKFCQEFFENRYSIKKALVTTSCTDALEMCAMLLDIKEGDEVIIPSFTFVSSALAFVRQGANIVFADSRADHPGVNELSIEKLITDRTKAIVVVHYAGVSCDMDHIMTLAKKFSIAVVEDAAQAIDSFYVSKDGSKRPLGSIGHLAAYSFHETKNVQCGEGGLLAINDDTYVKRAEIIWEKGTNRAQFFRGQVNKYGWVDTGSSFLPSEITAAFLYAQLQELNNIQQKRISIWQKYQASLKDWAQPIGINLPVIPSFATNNAHMFYLTCNSLKQRTELIQHLKKNGVMAVFHYQSLHISDFYKDRYTGEPLVNTERYSDNLVRLPFFYNLTDQEQNYIIEALYNF